MIRNSFHNAYAAEVAAYASRLGKPVEQIIVSHGHPDHWAGLEVLAARFPTASIAALPGVTEQIRTGGQTMLAGLRLAFGDLVAARSTIPTGTLTMGKQTLAGVPFAFRELVDIESDVQLLALMPDQKVMLAFDLVFASRDHAFTVVPHFDHWISVLDTLKGLEGYDTILIGHDLLTGQSGFDATMALLTCPQHVGRKRFACAHSQGMLRAGGFRHLLRRGAESGVPGSLAAWLGGLLRQGAVQYASP